MYMVLTGKTCGRRWQLAGYCGGQEDAQAPPAGPRPSTFITRVRYQSNGLACATASLAYPPRRLLSALDTYSTLHTSSMPHTNPCVSHRPHGPRVVSMVVRIAQLLYRRTPARAQVLCLGVGRARGAWGGPGRQPGLTGDLAVVQEWGNFTPTGMS